MAGTDPHRITTVAQLRARIGEPGSLVRHKLWRALDQTCIEFIQRSPFLLLATADATDAMDVSPKGDGPGFVVVENETTLLIPDRKGNKLLFGLQNILANPHVGIVFLIPGTEETLRVNGTAELTANPAILQRLSARGQPAVLAIRVSVHECFLHCAKAFKRAQLWDWQTWPPRQPISFGTLLAARAGGDDALAGQIDAFIEDDYKNNL
jgi:uncharacterized protein